MRRSVAALVAALGSLTVSAQDRTAPFRTEANYIRVDMYPTLRGRPIDDLLATEVEVADQGAAQKIDRFERVRLRGAQPQPASAPATIGAATAPAEKLHPLLFVLFLDTLHVEGNGSRGISRPLINALNDLTKDDLIALMTPEMNARDLTFTSRVDIEEVLRSWEGATAPSI